MKKILRQRTSWLLIILFCFGVAACTKETSHEISGNDGTAQPPPPPGPGPGPGATAYGWSLTAGNKAYGGCVDTAYYQQLGPAKSLTIETSDTAGNILDITLIAMSNFAPGTYSTSTGGSNAVFTTSAGMFTIAQAGTSFSVIVTKINDTLVEGSFSGTLKDISGGQLITITNGKFKALIGKVNPCGPVTPTPPPATAAAFSLVGAGGNCTNADVQGIYISGTPLGATNKVVIQVNVTTAGTYSVSTNTVNGYQFASSGTFTNTGVQNITLNGTGSPTAAGANSFALTAGTANCSFDVTVTAPAPPASFTYVGSPGSCTGATVNGTYTQTALTATNSVTVQVNVTTPGAYVIATNLVAGISFSKAGAFSTTGLQSVTLNGNGTPTTAGTHSFTVGGTGCTFNVSVVALPQAAAIYQCKIDGVLTSFTDRAEAELFDDFYTPPSPYLHTDGYSGPATGNTVPQFQMFIIRNNNSAVTPGSYNVNGFNFAQPSGYKIEIDYHVLNPDMSTTIWNTSSNIFGNTNPPFTIVVTSVTPTRVKGTFSGTLTNTLQGSTQTKTITEGVFDLPVN